MIDITICVLIVAIIVWKWSMLTTAQKGWDRINLPSSGLSVSQTGVGTVLSSEFALPYAFDLAYYARTISSFTSQSTYSGNVNGILKLQAYISGVWTDIFTITITANGVTPQYAYVYNDFGLSGSLTKFRTSLQVTAGTGSITGGFNSMVFRFFKPLRNRIITAA